jgi:hypothetical protein
MSHRSSAQLCRCRGVGVGGAADSVESSLPREAARFRFRSASTAGRCVTAGHVEGALVNVGAARGLCG